MLRPASCFERQHEISTYSMRIEVGARSDDSAPFLSTLGCSTSRTDADQPAFAQQLGAGLDLLDVVRDHLVRQRREVVPDRLRDGGAVGRRIAVRARLRAGDDGAGADAGQQLVRRLVLERLDLREARERRVVAAVEHVELHELR